MEKDKELWIGEAELPHQGHEGECLADVDIFVGQYSTYCMHPFPQWGTLRLLPNSQFLWLIIL